MKSVKVFLLDPPNEPFPPLPKVGTARAQGRRSSESSHGPMTRPTNKKISSPEKANKNATKSKRNNKNTSRIHVTIHYLIV